MKGKKMYFETEKVLVVENDVGLLEHIGLWLRREGLEVACVSDGETAIERFKAERPDLVVLDAAMPGKEELEVLHEIRSYSDVPVIITTRKRAEFQSTESFAREADYFLAVPFAPSDFVFTVKLVLIRERLRTSSAEGARV